MPEELLRLSLPWRAWLWLERSTVGMPLSLLVLDLFGTWGAADDSWNHHHRQANVRPLDWFAWVLVVIGPVALHHRRRVPRVALVVTLGATLTYILMGYAQGPIWLNAIVAVASTVGAGYRWAAWIASICFATGLLFAPAHTAGQSRLAAVNVLTTLLWLFAVTLIPELIRVLRERAMESVRIKEEEARRQASDERLAIARELHDVLAHSISLIAVQANVALEVMDRRPEQARIALVAIKDASKSALGEVRSVLDVLRGSEAAPRDPAPGLDRLNHLVTQAEAAGLRTALSVVGDVAEAPLAVSQAGYRIVQESLTNVVRHADATRASILVECVGGLRLRVVDDGRGAPLGFSDGSGNGLPGMRERATAFGGELTAGPLPSGGFRVAAYIPFPPTTRTDSMATHTDTGTDTDTGTGTEEHP
jgi:signal transduction histidine kinase